MIKLNQYRVQGGVELQSIKLIKADDYSFSIAVKLHYMGSYYSVNELFTDMSMFNQLSVLNGSERIIALFQTIERSRNEMIIDWLEETQYMLYTLGAEY